MLLQLKDVHPGMILDADVYTREGNLLISKDTELKDWHIKKMVEFDILNVKVRTKGIYNEYSHDFTLKYDDALGMIKDTFHAAKYKKVVKVNEFESIVDSLMNNTGTGRNLVSYMKMMGNKDEYILQHSINVSILSMLMGKWLKFDDDSIKRLGTAAMLHDIGKLNIPSLILEKPEKLTDDEFSMVKNHTRYGYQILKASEIDDDTICNVVLTHHERMDGKGYPFGLTGDKISEYSRIVSICDVFDAVTTDKSYKKKQNPLLAFKVIFDSSFRSLDPYFCKVFLNNAVIAYHGSYVKLNDGRKGKIIKISPENPTRPWININGQFVNLELQKNLEIEDVI